MMRGIKNNLKIMDDDLMDPVISDEEIAEDEEELDEDGMPKKIPAIDDEEEEDM